jgi:hypothetical protein
MKPRFSRDSLAKKSGVFLSFGIVKNVCQNQTFVKKIQSCQLNELLFFSNFKYNSIFFFKNSKN